MSWLAKLAAPKGCVSVELSTDYLSFAVRESADKKLSKLSTLHCDNGKDSYSELVQSYVHKHGLKGLACRFVLSAKDYQLLLVEAPDVPESELREALKWRVKDLINGTVEQSVIDVFTLPTGVSPSGKTMVYVVVAELQLIQSLINLSKECELKLESIDIEVLALRNLLQFKELGRGAAVVRLRENAGDVSIYRDGNLYLSRHFKISYSGGLLDDLPTEQLALEIQRSLDYFERQMGQAPPGVLFLCGEGMGPEKITDDFKKALPLAVEFFDLADELGVDRDEVDEGLLQLCLGAAGGALREAGI